MQLVPSLYAGEARSVDGEPIEGVFVPYQIQGSPKDWGLLEAEVSFAHRDILPEIHDTLIQCARVDTCPGLVLDGPSGVGKSAILRVLAGAFRQKKDWMVVYIPDCGEWARSRDPQAYFLARVEEGVKGYMAMNNAGLDIVPELLRVVVKPEGALRWEFPTGASYKIEFNQAWDSLCQATNPFSTLLVIDEVNELVSCNLLPHLPFSIATFDGSVKHGSMLVSGTPLHSYNCTLSADYTRYIVHCVPFSTLEQDRWLNTSLGTRVREVLLRDGLTEESLTVFGGVARSLALVGRLDSLAQARRIDVRSMRSCLPGYRMQGFTRQGSTGQGSRAEEMLAKACCQIFLYNLPIPQLDVLTSGLFFLVSSTGFVVPVNSSAESVLWTWLHSSATGLQEVDATMVRLLSTLQYRGSFGRRSALQEYFRLKIMLEPRHLTRLPVRRAQPAGEDVVVDTLELACSSYQVVPVDVRTTRSFPPGSFVCFIDQAPDGFEFYFSTPTAHVFIDTTVSQLDRKLPEDDDPNRTDVVLRAIGNFLGCKVMIAGNEIDYVQRHSNRLRKAHPTTMNPKIFFVVALTAPRPVVHRQNCAWVRYARLGDLVTAGIIPEKLAGAIGEASSE